MIVYHITFRREKQSRPRKEKPPPQLTVKAALWYDNKACGRRFPAHGLPVRIHVCGSSVTLRLGFLTESKSEDNKIATERAVVHICARGGIGRHDGFRFHSARVGVQVPSGVPRIKFGSI